MADAGLQNGKAVLAFLFVLALAAGLGSASAAAQVAPAAKNRIVQRRPGLREVESSGDKTNNVMLDACRNNPFPGADRASERGPRGSRLGTGRAATAFPGAIRPPTPSACIEPI
jgi:hypothetical protein